MEKILDKEQVQAQLLAKSEEISRRLGTIQDEVTNTGQAVRDAVHNNPLVGLGGAVAAGLLVGLLFGGSKKEKRRKDKGHLALIDAYVDSVAEEARRASRKGADTADAVRSALKDRVPVIFLGGGKEEEEPTGIFGEAFGLVYKTALGFAVKYAVDLVTAKLNLTNLAEAIEAQPGSDAAPPVAAVLSE